MGRRQRLPEEVPTCCSCTENTCPPTLLQAQEGAGARSGRRHHSQPRCGAAHRRRCRARSYSSGAACWRPCGAARGCDARACRPRGNNPSGGHEAGDWCNNLHQRHPRHGFGSTSRGWRARHSVRRWGRRAGEEEWDCQPAYSTHASHERVPVFLTTATVLGIFKFENQLCLTWGWACQQAPTHVNHNMPMPLNARSCHVIPPQS